MLPLNSTELPPDPPFSDEYEDDYVRRIYNEEITKNTLDKTYHELTGGYLQSGAEKGFKGKVADFGDFSPEGITIRSIRKNIFQFSAAKQYQQVVTMSDFIYENGLKSPYTEFKKLAKTVFDVYNKNYLKTEYATAVGQAQSARDWLHFEKNKEEFPWLKYHTQLDGHVRDQHAALEGLTARVDDPIWRHYAPKNGWNCRCFLTQEMKGKRSNRELPEFGTPEFPEVFDMNPGIDKLIFDPAKHPYFFVEKGDKDLKDNNFNLYVPN